MKLNEKLTFGDAEKLLSSQDDETLNNLKKLIEIEQKDRDKSVAGLSDEEKLSAVISEYARIFSNVEYDFELFDKHYGSTDFYIRKRHDFLSDTALTEFVRISEKLRDSDAKFHINGIRPEKNELYITAWFTGEDE